MIKKRLFWFSKNSKVNKVTVIEHILKYGDFDDILELFKRYRKDEIQYIWFKTMADDKRFIKINLMLARVFFNMDIETDYLRKLNEKRFKISLSIKEH
ncbi:hypothetical protein [Hippea jasoniae]|uniref:hypothetical protein n=1 Tax=Hippea jasoniae TaxID=944479 RepID=UPI00054E177D|nr:hypothetical protein [Hippea jasoniae]